MYVVVHYSEIGLKGENRIFFEKKLAENLKSQLKLNGSGKVLRRYGRLIIEYNKKIRESLLAEKLRFVPGVSSFSFAKKTSHDIKEIKKTVLDLISDKKFDSFRVTARRSNKRFPLSSQEINEKVGETVRKKAHKKVDLKNFDLNIYLEITEKETYVYTRKNHGISGLPVGSSGKVICSLSGGIDSPVASFMAMKRGLKVVFAHIKSANQLARKTSGKIENLVEQLAVIQGPSKLYIVPFEDIQEVIINKIPSKYRMILYRSFMMRIMERVCEKEGAGAIVTGDSIGQVASQTIPNLACIYDKVKMPVLSPLIGMNKEEIIEIGKKIATYSISSLPYPDCCSFMIAKHPSTKTSLSLVREMEKSIGNRKKLVSDCLRKVEVKIVMSNK